MLEDLDFVWDAQEALKGENEGDAASKKPNKGWIALMKKKHNGWLAMLEKLKEYRKVRTAERMNAGKLPTLLYDVSTPNAFSSAHSAG